MTYHAWKLVTPDLERSGLEALFAALGYKDTHDLAEQARNGVYLTHPHVSPADVSDATPYIGYASLDTVSGTYAVILYLTAVDPDGRATWGTPVEEQ